MLPRTREAMLAYLVSAGFERGYVDARIFLTRVGPGFGVKVDSSDPAAHRFMVAADQAFALMGLPGPEDAN